MQKRKAVPCRNMKHSKTLQSRKVPERFQEGKREGEHTRRDFSKDIAIQEGPGRFLEGKREAETHLPKRSQSRKVPGRATGREMNNASMCFCKCFRNVSGAIFKDLGEVVGIKFDAFGEKQQKV